MSLAFTLAVSLKQAQALDVIQLQIKNKISYGSNSNPNTVYPRAIPESIHVGMIWGGKPYNRHHDTTYLFISIILR